nr:uncharacterized protein LOC106685662 [Halyomorpha halys]
MDKYYNRLSLDDMNYYTPVTVDRAGIESIRSEERAARVWHHKWSWIIDEYRKIYDELKALKSEKADLAHVVLVAEDNRTMRPYPETTSGDVTGLVLGQEAWLCKEKMLNRLVYHPIKSTHFIEVVLTQEDTQSRNTRS